MKHLVAIIFLLFCAVGHSADLMKLPEEPTQALSALQKADTNERVKIFKDLLERSMHGPQEMRDSYGAEIVRLVLDLEAESSRRESLVRQQADYEPKKMRQHQKGMRTLKATGGALGVMLVGLFTHAYGLTNGAALLTVLGIGKGYYHALRMMTFNYQILKRQKLLVEIPDPEGILQAFDSAYLEVIGQEIDQENRFLTLEDRFLNQKLLGCGEVVKAQ